MAITLMLIGLNTRSSELVKIICFSFTDLRLNLTLSCKMIHNCQTLQKRAMCVFKLV
jgi:hypothetical protein